MSGSFDENKTNLDDVSLDKGRNPACEQGIRLKEKGVQD